MVFDGGPLPGKREEEQARKKYFKFHIGGEKKPSQRENRCSSKAMKQDSKN